MKYLKLFEDFNPEGDRETMIDILVNKTRYSREQLSMMSTDELDNLMVGDDFSDDDVVPREEEETDMTVDNELCEMPGVSEKKKLPEALQKHIDKKKAKSAGKEEDKKDAKGKKEEKVEDKKPATKAKKEEEKETKKKK